MEKSNKDSLGLSIQALKRMPAYLNCLRKVQKEGAKFIASPAIAAELKLNEVQVRKDLSAVSTSKGKPKCGFPVDELVSDIEEFLGYTNSNDAVLVGAGALGKALLSYDGYEKYGMNIIVAFDSDPELIGQTIGGKQVLNVEKLSDMCRRLRIHIGIITVPADKAQAVCDQLVAGGVLAIWNFAPTSLEVPEGILVEYEDAAVKLARLSQHLREKLGQAQSGE